MPYNGQSFEALGILKAKQQGIINIDGKFYYLHLEELPTIAEAIDSLKRFGFECEKEMSKDGDINLVSYSKYIKNNILSVIWLKSEKDCVYVMYDENPGITTDYKYRLKVDIRLKVGVNNTHPFYRIIDTIQLIYKWECLNGII
jgi:hypothetical protein